jgi:YceI-like domain
MRFFFLFLVLVFIGAHVEAQKYSTESGTISFFSDAPVEDISATNTEVGSLFDATSGDLVFVVPIKDFQFEKRLMREHFNEKYMETHKFPKSSFKGKAIGYDARKSGVQEVRVTGKLTIHGITRDVVVTGQLDFSDTRLSAKSKFVLKLADYGISVPQIVWQNIAEDIEVKIEFIYKSL